MTVLTTRATADPVGTRRSPAAAMVLRQRAGVVAVVVACAWWLLEVTRLWGGWDAPAVTVGAVLVAIAVILVRPDRYLPRFAVGVVAALSVGAFVVPLVAPTGWAGASGAAKYVCAAWLCLIVAATVVRHPDAHLWFLTVVMASVPVEFASGWLGWWGGNDPTRPMLGTFYWHNPYAAFLIPGGLIGLAAWVRRSRLLALLGLIAFVFASIGIWYSTSRAGLATFVLGIAVVVVAALIDPQRWRAIRQLAFAGALAAGGTLLISGPPFFSHRASPLAAEQTRAATNSLSQNGGQRLDFWREALTVFFHHPLTGGGYKSLVAESIGRVPASWPLSAYAHNGYLSVLAKGGLILGVPFLLAIVGLVVVGARQVAGRLKQRDASISRYVVPVALGCALLHAGVDFDWQYPANLAMVGVLAGLVVGRYVADRPQPTPEAAPRGARFALTALVLAGVALLGLSAWVMRDGDHTASLPTSHSPVLGQGAPVIGR